MLMQGDRVVEDELWKLKPAIERTAAAEIAKAMFDDMYDYLNLVANGPE